MSELLLISDESSWDAVIAPDGGEVSHADAERLFREHGVDLDGLAIEEQRFREVPVDPGKDWDRQFSRDHTGPLHGWVVDW